MHVACRVGLQVCCRYDSGTALYANRCCWLSHAVPHPCPCCAEGLKWGLDFEQALSDPDMVDLVTSPQVSSYRAIQ